MPTKLSRQGLMPRAMTPPFPSPPIGERTSIIFSTTLISPTLVQWTGQPNLPATSATMRLVERLTATGPGVRASALRTPRAMVASSPSGWPRSLTSARRSASASSANPTSAPERRTSSTSRPRFSLTGSGPRGNGSPSAVWTTTSQPSPRRTWRGLGGGAVHAVHRDLAAGADIPVDGRQHRLRWQATAESRRGIRDPMALTSRHPPGVGRSAPRTGSAGARSHRRRRT
jgi:hypothetical protein